MYLSNITAFLLKNHEIFQSKQLSIIRILYLFEVACKFSNFSRLSETITKISLWSSNWFT